MRPIARFPASIQYFSHKTLTLFQRARCGWAGGIERSHCPDQSKVRHSRNDTPSGDVWRPNEGLWKVQTAQVEIKIFIWLFTCYDLCDLWNRWMVIAMTFFKWNLCLRHQVAFSHSWQKVGPSRQDKGKIVPLFVLQWLSAGLIFIQNILTQQPFFTQVNHLVSTYCFSKQATNPSDFSILKIWDQSVDWLKSYGQKVNF